MAKPIKKTRRLLKLKIRVLVTSGVGGQASRRRTTQDF